MSLIKTHTCKTNQGELPVKGRFAPSPTGRMHAGNIFSALVAWLIAKSQGGKIVLRIEDLDAQRSKQRYIDAVMGDFEALGLFWDEGPFFQHGREEVYESAYKKLEEKGLVYPCFCTRADLHAASAPHAGERFVYPGTCRNLDSSQRLEKSLVRTPAKRLIVPDEFVEFDDCVQGRVCQNLSRNAGISSCVVPMAPMHTSSLWWWTMLNRGSLRSRAASICFLLPLSRFIYKNSWGFRIHNTPTSPLSRRMTAGVFPRGIKMRSLIG